MNVIQGGAQRHWLRLPNVSAPHPDDRTKTAIYSISDEFTFCNAYISRMSPIFWLWAHVVGELPPINNVRKLESGVVKPTLTTLADSVACFRGVNRPYSDEKDGHSVLVYVLNPLVSIEHEPSLVCLAKAVKVPTNIALTVQVKPHKALQAEHTALNKGSMTQTDGVVTRLEFVTGNGDTPTLPKRPDQRYSQRLWT